MDVYSRLKLEFPGINSTVRGYTSRGNISNLLDQLKTALSEKNIEIIRYCLGEIDKWYEGNISTISRISSSFDIQDHKRNKQLISEFKTDMLGYSFPQKETVEGKPNAEPLILISHSSSDTRYGDALQRFLVGIGIKNDQLIYTSHPLHKIPLDADIYEYLRQNIHNEIFMIILWSDKYLDSPACLNEMGAAWVTQTDYTNIFTPSFHFGNPKFHECAVNTKKLGAILNGDNHCKASMLELKNKVQEMFHLDNDEANSTYVLDEFIREIQEIPTQS